MRFQQEGAIIRPWRSKRPAIGRDVFVATGAVVIGDVTLGDEVNIWFGCVLRGDDDAISVGARTNIQDGTVIHVFKDVYPTRIGAGVTIAHGARLHGCTIHDDAMVGIGATVLDGAIVEGGAIVAAGAVVPPGKVVRAGELWAGCPAKLARPVKPAEIEFIKVNARHYCGLARSHVETMAAMAAE